MKRLNLWLLLMLLVFGVSYRWGGAWLGKQGTPEVPAPAAEPMAVAESGGGVRLVVLNGTREKGLAKQFRIRLGWAGWETEKIGNTPRETMYAHSFLVNRRLSSGEITRLAARLGGLRVLQEYDPRTEGDAVLVLGRDHERLAALLPMQPGL